MTQHSETAPLDVLNPHVPGEDRKRFLIDGREPQVVVFPESIEHVSSVLCEASERRRAVAPIGTGAFLHIGGLPRRYDLALPLTRLNQVVDYQPTDMTVTVAAGVTLERLQQLLGENRQWLPLDPPVPEQVTVGGLIATNLSGPVRLSQGTVRDFLIGLKVVRADGTVIKGGGRVVKNVAGYDVPKLYCGSFGTLGVVVEATFKVRPLPEARSITALTFPSAESAMDVALRLLGSDLQPSFLELTNVDLLQQGRRSYRLFAGFAGLTEEVAYQRTGLRDLIRVSTVEIEEREESLIPFVQTLQDFPVSGEALLRWKASLLPTQVAEFVRAVEEEAEARGLAAQVVARAGNGVVYGRVPDKDGVGAEKLLPLIDGLRVLAKRLQGYVVIEGIDPLLKAKVDVWGHVGGVFPLMKRMKETLDPHSILNPGRFVGGI